MYSQITVDTEGDFWIHCSDWGEKKCKKRLYMSSVSSLFLQMSQKSCLATTVWETASPSCGSGNIRSPSGKVGWCNAITDPGMKPWGHLDGSASCGRPPSPPQWEPSLVPSCCTASSSHPAAAAPPPASPACPLLLMPERRKQMGVTQRSPPEKTWRRTQPYRLQLLLFLLFTLWITAVRGVFLVLFVFLFLLLFHHFISVHLGITFT